MSAVVAAAIKGITTILEEFGTGNIQSQSDLFARLVAGLLNRFHQNLARFHVAQIRSEASFITHGGAHAFVLEQSLQGVEHFGAHAQRLSEAWGAMGNQHEFLEIKAVGGVRATIDHIHQWHRQQRGHRSAQIAVERQSKTICRCTGIGHAHRQDCVGAEAGLVVAAVEFQHRCVYGCLIQGRESTEGGGNALLDVIDGLDDALAHVAIAAIAQLVGFVGTGAGTTRHDGPTTGSTFQQDLGFHRWISAGVEHLTGHDGVDDEVEGIEHVMRIKDLAILWVPLQR